MKISDSNADDAMKTTRRTTKQKVASITKPIVEMALQSLLISEEFHQIKVLNIADLGCSTGPNTLSVIATVKETVDRKFRELKNCQTPELQFYLNDLHGNDFNSLFKGLLGLAENYGFSCFFMGVPGSFHGRLFPQQSLHFVHSSYSVHWLSQVPKGLTTKEGLPLNKGKIYISKTSPPSVREACLAQFQQDFTLFLKCLSEEMVPNGYIIFIIHGKQSSDPYCKQSFYVWEILAEAIAKLVSQGMIDEEKLDSFNVPYYIASSEEVQDIVEREGSFSIEHTKKIITLVGGEEEQDKDLWANGVRMTLNMRSFAQSIISHHFGEEILDELYNKVTQLVVENLEKESTYVTSIVSVLKRRMG